jgi:ferredoxin
MISNLPGTGEAVGFCYDECPVKFNSAELCVTNNELSFVGPPNCAPKDIRYVCVADCPGGYTEVTVNAQGQKMLTCAYKYPNNIVPFDPNLFVQCPIDGTMIQVDLSETTTPNGTNVNPKPPVCIRKIFQRNVSCPQDYIYVPPDFTVSPPVGAQCVQNCPAGSVPVWQNGAITCMSTCPQDGRFAQDYHSTYTSASILPEFRDANCIRKTFSPGDGADPNELAPQPNANSDARNIGLIILAVFIGFLVLSKFKFF